MKKSIITLATFTLLSTSIFAETKHKVPTKEASKIFKAAGFSKTKYGWEGNCDIGEITTYKDLNGDGLKDAIISDADSTCYGREMVGYHIISQDKKGIWKMIVENRGTPTFLDTKGKDGWPDLINAGSGFCFAVFRWDGQEYKVHRYEYEGKACSLR
ncbi:hypothetical protein [Acinetobacter modestus]|uniref:hypothetical protein n=1 Tax=Acinetobacter modestus TaxID=1776740 RepID=UPI001F4BA3F8|nr:hypothetical protein [Acinetobacter modestus]MCH7329793.1 hypothetical protein [Acinetobacter modestus]